MSIAPLDLVSPERLARLLRDLVEIPSPTGDEAPMAQYLAAALSAAGAAGQVQVIDDRQANAHGRLRGDGTGADLLLYSPVDTLTTGRPDEDVTWNGPLPAAHTRPTAAIDGDIVSGLGAFNPKGHAVCVLHAMEVLAEAGVSLCGDVIAGFGAGGMPTNAIAEADGGRPRRANTGQGAGCSFLLEQGVHPDVALIAKPGVGVSYEEVGLAWFDVTVRGVHTYVGSRHLIPYHNAVAAAGELAVRLEDWFRGYADRHTDGQVAPQGIVATIEAGRPRMAAVTPAWCRLRVDLRLSPRTTPAAARREFTGAVVAMAAELGIAAEVEMVLAISGTTTAPDSAIVRRTVEAWGAENGQAHEWPARLSGATDANILRSRGVPTARVGMSKVPGMTDFAAGMNTASLGAMAALTRVLVRVALDICTRPPEEVLP